jgi:hypothetical protein
MTVLKRIQPRPNKTRWRIILKLRPRKRSHPLLSSQNVPLHSIVTQRRLPFFLAPHLTSIRVLLLLHSYSAGVLFYPLHFPLSPFIHLLGLCLVWTLYTLLDSCICPTCQVYLSRACIRIRPLSRNRSPGLLALNLYRKSSANTPTLPTRISPNNCTPWGESLQQSHLFLLVIFPSPSMYLAQTLDQSASSGLDHLINELCLDNKP